MFLCACLLRIALRRPRVCPSVTAAEYAEEKKESEEGAGDGKTAEFPYFVGQQLDVLDDVNRWSEAEVLQVDRKESKIFITYLFWSEKFNEWIAVPSERVVPLHTHTYYPGGVLKVGQRIEVLDERRCWLEAFVIDEKRIEVQIHYRGFAPKFDEWIPRDSNRIRPYGREKEVVKRKKLRGFQATSTPRVAQITAATDRFSQYQNALRQQDLRLVSVPGDGNCLFRAVSHQIYGDDQYHDLVRQSCMDYMLVRESEVVEDWLRLIGVSDVCCLLSFGCTVRTERARIFPAVYRRQRRRVSAVH